MIYNFTIAVKDQGTEYGLVTANSIEEAEGYVRECFDFEKVLHFDIEPGAEDFINKNYGGLALLTTTF